MKTTFQRTSAIQSAFTLIELLVVIAILGFLTAIALPAIYRSLEKSRAAQGLSNMRQIGVAMALYAGENDNYLPLMRTFWPQQPYGLEGIEPYLETVNGKGAGRKLYVCPNRKIKAPMHLMEQNGWLNYRTFSCNPNVHRWAPGGTPDPGSLRIKVLAIPRASQVISVIDASQRDDGTPANGGLNGLPLDPTDARMREASRAEEFVPTTGDSDPQSQGTIRYRQPGKTANALFVDGHVEAVKKGTLLNKNFSVAY
jgi:prepilin-type N-terminal cleavage/methylation domain-containing protein/prepilin-type processing-associated H-X9-DG protein